MPDAQKLRAGTDPHDPASVLRLSQPDKTATGMQMQLSPLRQRRLAKPRLPTLTGKTYRIDDTDDLTSHQWHPVTAPIPGDGKPVQVLDPAGAVLPQRFYRLRVEQP